MAITTRAGKGSPLTHTEMDGNITAIPELTSSTGVVKGASGTTAQRPATAVAGYTRFNTTIGRHETYSGSAWIEDVNTADASTSGMGFVIDEDGMGTNSATKVPTQQSVKAYVDAQVTASDLDFQGDSGGALSIDLDAETLTIAGGTGLTSVGSSNTVTVNIDATVATLTGSQALTNKTIDVDSNTVSNIEVDNLKSGVLDIDLTSVAATDTTLPSAKAVKTYVDAQVQSKDALSELSGTLDDITDGTTYKKYAATEKTKLAGIATSANNYVHPTGAGDKHIPTAGASGQFLKYSASGTAVWAADNNTTYAVGDGGLTTNDFTNADHTKLDGIEASADVTDVTNVTAAGALMDSELAGIAAVKATTGTFLTADQTKLDGIATSANNYVHPSSAGDKHIPTGGASGQVLAYSSSGTAVWSDGVTLATVRAEATAIAIALG